jgi:crotonobetainyl-CoA:carnitine CoA-transferase CaiB-like acyl-CoA transferase
MANHLPLENVKICDFMWVMAGPASTRILADYGATVVRIESPTRIDTARTLQPYLDNKLGPDSSGLFANCNAGKFGISLDLANPAAREVVHDLVRWADIVTESFSPKAMRAWGFDYESLRKVNPKIIMLSSCLMGQTGPLAKIAGFGNMAAAIVGFHNLTGWPDRPPAGVFGAYTDYVAPRFTAMALLAALDYRRRTGQGQYIDQSQAECAIHFLGPAILDYTVNGRIGERLGNTDPVFAPHGVYQTAGQDQDDDDWVAIVCRNDDDWRRLCTAMKNESLARDQRFATAAGRREHRNQIDSSISAWTRTLDPAAIETLLQSHGVPSHQLQNSAAAYRDPQLTHRNHFVTLEHPTLGKFTVEGPRAKLSRTPATVRRSAPTLGQDNQLVLEKILNYDETKITELASSGALG